MIMKKNYKKPAERIVTTEFQRHILLSGSPDKSVKGLSEDTNTNYGLNWDSNGIDEDDLDM
jgi:hypothetical protein